MVFEGYLAGGTAAGGQIATTDSVENFPGFPEAVGGIDLAEKLRHACSSRLKPRPSPRPGLQ